MNDNMIEFRMGMILLRFPMSEIRLAKEIIVHVLETKIAEERDVVQRGAMS